MAAITIAEALVSKEARPQALISGPILAGLYYIE
jgi:hypothetical protein